MTARGLAIRTGDEPGEEFPLFREFWVEKPTPASNTLTMHALLDSASMTGAFRFTVRPLETTIIDTEMTLIARVATDKFGIGAMAADYLFSALDHRRADDWRAAVYESTGLQILSGNGEWLWRPVTNRETLQISAFSDLNPRGFGLLAAHPNLRRLLRRRGPLGTAARRCGSSRSATGATATCACSKSPPPPKPTPTSSPNGAPRPASPRRRASRSPTASSGAGRRPRGRRLRPARRSRRGKIGGHQRFAVEMAGDVFADPQKAAAATADIHAIPGKIVSVRLFPYKDRRSVRVVFDLDPGSETYSELRLTLNLDNQPASETWLYRWTA